MFEYKVINVKVKDAEEQMNALAREGWRVISVIDDLTTTAATIKGLLLVTLEREKSGTAL